MDQQLIDLIEAIYEFEGSFDDFHPERFVLENKEQIFELH